MVVEVVVVAAFEMVHQDEPSGVIVLYVWR